MIELKSILKNDIDRTIDGVIKADDREHLLQEVEEYVITREILKQLDTLVSGYKDSIEHLKMGKIYPFNGVWISGYFGSGKSHLLKILSYILGNEQVNGTHLSDLFLPKIRDHLLRADLTKIVSIPSVSILFNIDQEADALHTEEDSALLSIFEKVFNRYLGYFPHNRNIAEFERHLDEEGILEGFKTDFQKINGTSWEQTRSSCFGIGRSKLVKTLEKSLGITGDEVRAMIDQYNTGSPLSVEGFVNRIKTWLDKKKDPSFRLNFFIDEVGQFVAGKSKLMLNLQTLAETFGTVCNGRVWIFVTSQEDLTSVVGDPTAKQVQDYSKINARYHFRISLSSADVQEVIQKRLLAKTEEGIRILSDLYMKEKESFKTLFFFASGGTQISFKDKDQFAMSYPFQAYQYDLLQQALRGLSEHNAFHGQHISHGERSMLEIFQDVAKRRKNDKLFTWVTFDEMFEGIRQTLNTSMISAVNTAEKHLENPMARKLLKILLLVKYVKTFIATLEHLKILLLHGIDQDINKLDREISEALSLLTHQTYIRKNGSVYEYLTNEEKDVEEEIKQMDVSHDEIRKFVSENVFSGVLKLTSSKIHDMETKEDFPFKRIVNGETIGKTVDLGIHLITPDHPNYENRKILLNQSMGKKELLVILEPDVEFKKELTFYFQTDLYCRQRTGTEENHLIQRIIAEKKEYNSRRKEEIREKLEILLSRADLFVMGNEINPKSTDPAVRILEGFRSLIRQAYPHLKFLGQHHYSETDLKKTIYPEDKDKLFIEKAVPLNEAEQEMLNRIRIDYKENRVVSMKILVDTFSAGQYGWYYWAIIIILARLYAADLVELSQGAKVKSREEVFSFLSTNHDFDQVRIKPIVDVVPGEIKALKDLHLNIFNKEIPEGNAKESAVFFKNSLQILTQKMEEWIISKGSEMPFLKEAKKHSEELQKLLDHDYSYFLKKIPEYREELEKLNREELEPLQTFMTGNQVSVWKECQDFLEKNKNNLIEIGKADVVEELISLLSKPPYHDNNLKKMKDLVRSVQTILEKRLISLRKETIAHLNNLIFSLENIDGFDKLVEEDQARLKQPLNQILESIKTETRLGLIRDASSNFSLNVLETAHKELLRILNPETKVIFANSTEKKVPFYKTFLETEKDVYEYTKALETRYLELVKENKRISI